ncbi:hypothetical protein BGZ99_006377 [Dissophora globulifera]|uniref:Uncharacterized protein n=1 Tax=Dissophora globulifera TaxID=979702 RepID=A0A9P6UZS6_9FUNG|nr:hypothetical protein BGZ99_006377 [Dissophora globulifera]
MSSSKAVMDCGSDQGLLAPRIRVGYSHQGHPQSNQGRDVPQNNTPSSSHRHHAPFSKRYFNNHRSSTAFSSTESSPSSSSSSSPSSSFSKSSSGQTQRLSKIDQQLFKINELLIGTVLLPVNSPVDPAPFLALDCLEVYGQDLRHCVERLRQERRRLLDKKHAIEMAGMKQELAETRLKSEEKRLRCLEIAAETAALAPESLVPLSKSRTQLLDDLGCLLGKIRSLLETVHLQMEAQSEEEEEEDEDEDEEESVDNKSSVESRRSRRRNKAAMTRRVVVDMTLFRRDGLIDLYDRDPKQCVVLLRAEHTRLATRRDDLELEYERQRTALLETHATMGGLQKSRPTVASWLIDIVVDGMNNDPKFFKDIVKVLRKHHKVPRRATTAESRVKEICPVTASRSDQILTGGAGPPCGRPTPSPGRARDPRPRPNITTAIRQQPERAAKRAPKNGGVRFSRNLLFSPTSTLVTDQKVKREREEDAEAEVGHGPAKSHEQEALGHMGEALGLAASHNEDELSTSTLNHLNCPCCPAAVRAYQLYIQEPMSPAAPSPSSVAATFGSSRSPSLELESLAYVDRPNQQAPRRDMHYHDDNLS